MLAVRAKALAPSQRVNCLMQLAQPLSQAIGISRECTLVHYITSLTRRQEDLWGENEFMKLKMAYVFQHVPSMLL